MHLRYKFKFPIDDPNRTLEHAEIIQKKGFLRRLYIDWYNILLREVSPVDCKKILELGSGGGFIKDLAPRVITSDYLDLPTNDMSFSALSLPFVDEELDAILMIDTFHHIPDVKLFLSEVARTMKPGGRLVMIEPANSWWGRLIYRNFHHEPFDVQSTQWKLPANGPLSSANGALPWIVFERDYKEFESLFPTLRLMSVKYHTPFAYLVSGGLTMRSLLPEIFYAPIRFIDRLFADAFPSISMFTTIILERNYSDP